LNTLLSLSYSEGTSGDFSCNDSQYCKHGRTGSVTCTVRNRLISFLKMAWATIIKMLMKT